MDQVVRIVIISSWFDKTLVVVWALRLVPLLGFIIDPLNIYQRYGCLLLTPWAYSNFM